MLARGRLLFLTHRMPYPPEKGEKIRAWHILRHLAAKWEIDLAFPLDRRADLDHLPAVLRICSAVEWRPAFSRTRSALRALLHARAGTPLSLAWFADPDLKAWVRSGLAAGRYHAVFVYSSAMAPYVLDARCGRPGPIRILDMVDVDSEKWRAYAAGALPPWRQVWSREARTLLAFERHAAQSFDQTLFVSQAERERFLSLAPECASRTDWVDNGVDLVKFDPRVAYPLPFATKAPAIVFTGTMGYRPNVQAVCWFAENVLPLIRAALPGVQFHIVGADPAPAVRALARLPGVHVTGPVPDVRPYLAHADAVVAPMLVARGIQNKVLEAMAMGRPVIASSAAHEGLRAVHGRDLLVCDGAEETAARVAGVLRGEHPGLGEAGRRAVSENHDWSSTLERLDRIMECSRPGPSAFAPEAATPA